MSSLAGFNAYETERLAAALRWKQAGGRIVGYLCDNVPVELIEAAGFLPLRVQGGGRGGVERVRAAIDTLFPPDVTTRPVFVDALLERLLDGTYSMLDYLVIPHNRHAIQSMYRELNTARAEDPSLRLPELFLLDKAWCPTGDAAAFDYDSVLPAGQRLAVRRTANLHTGGTLEDVTSILHPVLKDAAVRAARALDIPVVGLDMLVPAADQPEYVFIEANERAGLANHQPQPTAERFIDLLFPLSQPSS